MKWNQLALLIFVSFFTPGQQFTVKTTVAAGPMCKIDSDCQENAYCFKNEVHFQKTGEHKADCICKLGMHPELGRNPTDDIYPKTGYCVDLTIEDACKFPELCIVDNYNWGICPYCRAFKYHEHGGEVSLGKYVQGRGSYDDPQIYSEGDSVNCGNSAKRSSKVFWYCYYQAFGNDVTVPLNTLEMFWIEDPQCHYTAYLYTPMACQQFTEKTTVAAGPMCKIDTDCQENAYCFSDEVHFEKTGEHKADCICKLGMHSELGRNPTDDIYPKTGYCVDLTIEDACKFPELCIVDNYNWGICPYCRAFKYHEHGGEVSLGKYVQGRGSYDDPQIYSEGDSVNCGNSAKRSSKAFWYCYYQAFENDVTVPLNTLEMLWIEDPQCHYTAYLYTPMACQWAD